MIRLLLGSFSLRDYPLLPYCSYNLFIYFRISSSDLQLQSHHHFRPQHPSFFFPAISPALGSPAESHQTERDLPPLPCSLPANDSRNSWVESTLQQVATLALTCTWGLFLVLVSLYVIITKEETPVLLPALASSPLFSLLWGEGVAIGRSLCFSYLVISVRSLFPLYLRSFT